MATNKIKIVQGNDLPLCKKLTTINGGVVTAIPVGDVEELKVWFGMSTLAKATEVEWSVRSTSPSIIHFRLESTQISKLGEYNIWISGKYGENDVVVSYGSIIEVIEWSSKSNVGEFIYTDEQALDDSIFIPACSEGGGSIPPEQYNALAKEETITSWITNSWTTFGNWIESQFDSIAQKSDIPTDYARAGDVAKSLDDIKIDTPSLAKQGDNPDVSLSSIAKELDMLSEGYAKQLEEIIGTKNT